MVTIPKSRRLGNLGLDQAFERAFAAKAERRIAETSLERLVDRSAPLLDWSRAYLPNYFQQSPSALHTWLAEEVHGARRTRGVKINVVGPRGGAKSTVGALANILRCAVEGTEPYIWIVSGSGDQAEAQLRDIRIELEENEQLARDYPEACGKGAIWRDGKLRLRNNVVIEAISKKKKIRGKKNRQDRPTLIVCDDLQDVPVMVSAEQREVDWKWLNGTLGKAGDHRTNIINLANAYHREDIGLRLDVTPGWRSKIFSAIVAWPSDMGLWELWGDIYCDLSRADREPAALAFYEANRSAMDAGAELLWPEREPLYLLMCMWIVDRSAFEREKQSRPVNPENCEWPEEYFDDRIWFDEWPTTWQVRTLALDPSKGRDARRGDYSAFVSLVVGVDGYLFVDADLKRRDTDAIVVDGVEIYRAFGPDVFGVEGNAWQELLGGSFSTEFARQGMLDTGVATIDNRVNKQVRIRRLGKYLSQRRLKFKRGSAGALLLISQLRDFPDAHAHDDGPDALEMAERLAREFLSGQHSDHPEFIDV